MISFFPILIMIISTIIVMFVMAITIKIEKLLSRKSKFLGFLFYILIILFLIGHYIIKGKSFFPEFVNVHIAYKIIYFICILFLIFLDIKYDLSKLLSIKNIKKFFKKNKKE